MEGADERVKSAAKPNREKEPIVRQASGNVARSADDARGNGVADGNGDAESDAEDLEQGAFVFAGIMRSASAGRGEGIGRQGVVSVRR